MIKYKDVKKDLSLLPKFIEEYETRYLSHKEKVKLEGKLIGESVKLSGIMEEFWAELQEIEAVLEYLHVQLKIIRSKFFAHYMGKGSNRILTGRDAEKYIDGEADVALYSELINDTALIRNKYLGLTKALEIKSFRIKDVSLLYSQGLDQIEIHNYDIENRN